MRVRPASKPDLLPDSVLVAVRAAEVDTADHREMTLLVAVAYGEREDLADAGREMLRDKLTVSSARRSQR